MKTNDITLAIGKHTYTACFYEHNGETYGILANGLKENEAKEDENLDMDCWGLRFVSKDNPKHTIEVNLGYDNDGFRDNKPFYAVVYDERGNEVEECVTVTLIPKEAKICISEVITCFWNVVAVKFTCVNEVPALVAMEIEDRWAEHVAKCWGVEVKLTHGISTTAAFQLAPDTKMHFLKFMDSMKGWAISEKK